MNLGSNKILLCCVFVVVGLGVWSLSAQTDAFPPDSNAAEVYLDRGAAGMSRYLAAIRTRASMLMITAHPDDEDGGMLLMQTRGLGTHASLMTLTRGEGGQNAMTNDLYDALGLMRTQELLLAGRYYGVEQYWGRQIDYGFSKTREEALEKWGFDRTLSDVVRVIRMTRPLVLTSIFVGAPTDGHGNHQVAGQMAQEAFVAAADPNRFPEQIREGLRPWAPAKVYERVPNFSRMKDNTIYDYATDKYVPIRFFDYVAKTWLTQKPSVNVTIAEGTWDPATGLTFLQMSRQGWGFQKSQYGGGTLPQPSLASVSYHRFGSRVQSGDQEATFYDGIDTSLAGICGLATGDVGFLKAGLQRLSDLADTAASHYRPDAPGAIAPDLAKGLALIRTLLKETAASGIAEPGKSDVIFELTQKEGQFQKALTTALGLSFDTVVAPDKEPAPGSTPAVFAGAVPTFTTAIPGQPFHVQANLLNLGSEELRVENLAVEGQDGKNWAVKPEASPKPELPSGKDLHVRFSVTVPEDAALTRPFYSRPNQEQPYYDVNDERFRNLSVAPYPLAASARLVYQGTELDIRKVVQTNQRTEGIGMLENPLLIGPAISVAIAPAAGAVPLQSTSFQFSCTLHSNVKGPAKGVVRLELPAGWRSTPEEVPFSMARDGENETVTFAIAPKDIQTKVYDLKAVAEFQGKKYDEGYRLVGYPGLRPYPYYRPATYKATGVDVKTAPGLHIGFLPGTGDDVPRALQDLGLPVQMLSTTDLETGNLSAFDAIVLGVRAYAVRPDLRAANNRLLKYVNDGGTLIVQYNLQNFDRDYGPYPFALGSNPQKVVDEFSKVKFLDAANPAFAWPNRITATDFANWQEERGHGFMEKWDPRYKPLVEVHDPGQDPQEGGLLLARYGKGFYVYDAFALYRQLPEGVPGAYRILANLVSLGKNPEWK